MSVNDTAASFSGQENRYDAFFSAARRIQEVLSAFWVSQARSKETKKQGDGGVGIG